MSAKLKPCPFCAGPAKLSVAGAGVFKDWYMAQAYCNRTGCAASGLCVSGRNKRTTERSAREAWNRRAPGQTKGPR